jgi:hypothetical protein
MSLPLSVVRKYVPASVIGLLLSTISMRAFSPSAHPFMTMLPMSAFGPPSPRVTDL